MTESESYELVAMLMAAYPGARVHDGTGDVYAAMLADLAYGEAKAAITALMAELKFMPSIAEIRDRAASAKVNAQSPELAWASVLQSIRECGIYRTPKFDDPCTAVAVSNVGWRTLCNSQEDMLGVQRAHFVRAYQAALALAKREHNTDRLLDHVDRKRIAGLHGAGDDDREAAESVGEVLGRLKLVDGGQ